MSIDEYLSLEHASAERWEYVDGEAFAMAGASLRHASSMRHSMVAANVLTALKNALRGMPCFPLGSDQRIETSKTRAFHYPDVVVVCGKPVVSAKDDQTITNPTVLIEIASPSTSDYDCGAKFDHYTTIPELREFVAIFTETRRIEHRARTGDGQWVLTHLVGGELVLASLGVRVSFDDVYADLDRVEL